MFVNIRNSGITSLSFGMNSMETANVMNCGKSEMRTSLRCIDIHELLPQQEPFVMVGMLTEYDSLHTSTETTIKADNMFVEGNALMACGVIENIAQTCAARIGYYNKYILKRGIQIGVVGAMQNVAVSVLPNVGDTIYTTITVTAEMFGMILADAKVVCKDEVIATGKVKIAVKDEEEPA